MQEQFGTTENARKKNVVPFCGGWKMRDMKMRHNLAGVRNAAMESQKIITDYSHSVISMKMLKSKHDKAHKIISILT